MLISLLETTDLLYIRSCLILVTSVVLYYWFILAFPVRWPDSPIVVFNIMWFEVDTLFSCYTFYFDLSFIVYKKVSSIILVFVKNDNQGEKHICVPKSAIFEERDMFARCCPPKCAFAIFKNLEFVHNSILLVVPVSACWPLVLCYAIKHITCTWLGQLNELMS